MKTEDELRDEAALALLPLYTQIHTRQVQPIAGTPPKIEIDTGGAAFGAYQAAQSFVLARRQVLGNLAAAEVRRAEKESRRGGANGTPAEDTAARGFDGIAAGG